MLCESFENEILSLKKKYWHIMDQLERHVVQKSEQILTIFVIVNNLLKSEVDISLKHFYT